MEENLSKSEDISDISDSISTMSFESSDFKQTTETSKKKKKRHFFEYHISKILQEVCPERNITYQAKKQLNEIAVLTCKLISEKTFLIVEYSGKKTITNVEIGSAVTLVFNGQLAQKAIEEGKKCIEQYSSNLHLSELKGQHKNTKAEILVPPSILETFLRSKGHHISATSSIFLAGIIEYFLAQILDIANNVYLSRIYRRKSSPLGVVKIKPTVRISLYDIEMGIKSDKELYKYIVSNNIYLYGSGIVPFIHPLLLARTGDNDKKSLKMISKIQNDNTPIFTKSIIDNKLKNYITLIYPEIRYQKNCFNVIQDYIEKWIIEILKHANNITLYSGKTRVSSVEIEMVLAIMERRMPEYIEPVYDTGDYIVLPETFE
jgi:histone H3/H4